MPRMVIKLKPPKEMPPLLKLFLESLLIIFFVLIGFAGIGLTFGGFIMGKILWILIGIPLLAVAITAYSKSLEI